MTSTHRHLSNLTIRPISNPVKCMGGTRSVKDNPGRAHLRRGTARSSIASSTAESVDGEIDTQTFLNLCHAAWREPHDFLMIDHHPREAHPSGFRRNFDTFLVP